MSKIRNNIIDIVSSYLNSAVVAEYIATGFK